MPDVPKRGRKAEPEQEYLRNSVQEIERLRVIASKTKCMKERNRLRNQAAALKTRVEKRV